MIFNAQVLQDRLSGKHIGSSVHFFDELESTNNTAFTLALNGAPEGSVVVADHQTRGKGRLKRVWQSPPKCNLYTSIILRPDILPVFAPQITLMSGVAVAELLSEHYSMPATLKWPNDVQIKGKKICGILTEMKVAGDHKVEFVIVGIGVNVNMRKEHFDEPFREESTSMKEEAGRDISLLDFTVQLYHHLEHWYNIWIERGFAPVRETWLQYSSMSGKRIRMVLHDHVQEGDMLGIDEYGSLLLRDETGVVKKMMAGDASVLKE